MADGFDLAIRFGEPEPSSLISRKILETHVLTCAAPSYVERIGTPKHPRDPANHECIQYPASRKPIVAMGGFSKARRVRSRCRPEAD